MGLHLFPSIFKRFLLLTLLFGILHGVCRAPQTQLEPDRQTRGRLGDKYIHDRLPFWQKKLALEDWNISILCVHPTDLRPRTLGNIHWDTDNKTAVIRVLDAADYRMPLRATLKDMEFTIVHELIHLEMVSLPRSEASRSDEEHAINHIADALLGS